MDQESPTPVGVQIFQCHLGLTINVRRGILRGSLWIAVVSIKYMGNAPLADVCHVTYMSLWLVYM